MSSPAPVKAPDLIPPADPRAGVIARRDEIDAAIRRTLEGGHYILGPEVEAFEREFADYLGVAHVVGVGSGTDALVLALRAAGVAAGDEVITVSHTAVATVAAIELAGAIPVLVDIESGTMTIDPAAVERAITPRTRALLPVHLYGHPAAILALRTIAQRHRLRLIEDCAQSHGATLGGIRTGALGDAAAFSFYPTKNLGALGDGGAVATADAGVAEAARCLREYGWRERYVSEVAGVNSRLDELQAAVLRVKLRHLEEDNARRVALAGIYRDELAGTALTLPVVREGCTHVYHQYAIRHRDRDALRAALRARGVGSLIHYPVPVHLQPAYRGRLRLPAPLEHSERTAATVLSLPMFPELGAERARRAAAMVRQSIASLTG
jgi:dTDP-4-amino-4,6-dideoxygalactose transaminase